VRDTPPAVMPSEVVLSPHLDDAVLSAWHAVSSPVPSRVVTVCAGVPEPGFVTDLDRAHRAEESAAWLRRRRADDRAALALAGREPVHLDLLEVQFPAYRIPRLREAIAADPGNFLRIVVDEPDLHTDPAELVDLLYDHVPSDAVVYGPAGIGRHPDHRDLAQATVRLAERVREVRLYADSPYYVFHGLPSWITGEPNPEADARVEQAFAALALDPVHLDRHVIRLPRPVFARKQEAMQRYATEYPSMQADLARPGSSPEMMRYEVYWTVPGARR
jgi:LmbE family N-acetylglucosaminyl deacetylase